jgi:hypothetical protein
MHLPVVHVYVVVKSWYVHRPVVRFQGLLPPLQTPVTTTTLMSTTGKRLDNPRFLGTLSQHVVVEYRLLKRLAIKIRETIVTIQVIGQEVTLRQFTEEASRAHTSRVDAKIVGHPGQDVEATLKLKRKGLFLIELEGQPDCPPSAEHRESLTQQGVRVLDTLPKKAKIVLDCNWKTIHIQGRPADDLCKEAPRTAKQARRRSSLNKLHRSVRVLR